MNNQSVFQSVIGNLKNYLTQWYMLYLFRERKYNVVLFTLCVCITPSRKKILDLVRKSVSMNHGNLYENLTLETILEFDISKQVLIISGQCWLFDNSPEVILNLLSSILSTDEDLKDIADSHFCNVMAWDKTCGMGLDYVIAVLKIYQYINDKDGIEKCADWLWSSRGAESYPKDLFFRTNLYIEVGAFVKIKKQLDEAREIWSGKGEYDWYVNFYDELLDNLEDYPTPIKKAV